MAKKMKLGRGIDALMDEIAFDSPVSEDALSGEQVIDLDPRMLKPNPFQPRKAFNKESLQELSDSIKEHGVIQPILVTKSETGGFYIIAGERRTRASILAGLERVPVVLKELDDEKKLEIALIENIQREDLNPIEEALAYHSMMQMGNLRQEEVAKRVGKSRSAVANALRLLKLSAEMQHAVENGTISAGHARTLLSINDEGQRLKLFNRIITSNLSVRETESEASDLNTQGTEASQASSPRSVSVPDDVYFQLRDLEQQLINSLGTKVAIKGSMKSGTVEIAYFSPDDLQTIYELLRKG